MTRLYGLLTAATLLGIPAAASMGGPQRTESSLVAAPTTAGIARGGKLLRITMPVYPAGARHAQVSGVVRVEAWIGKDGRVVDTNILSGPSLLRRAAQDAVKRWRYAPTVVDGQPIDRIARFELDFRPATY